MRALHVLPSSSLRALPWATDFGSSSASVIMNCLTGLVVSPDLIYTFRSSVAFHGEVPKTEARRSVELHQLPLSVLIRPGRPSSAPDSAPPLASYRCCWLTLPVGEVGHSSELSLAHAFHRCGPAGFSLFLGQCAVSLARLVSAQCFFRTGGTRLA